MDQHQVTPRQERAIRTRAKLLAAATAVIRRDGAAHLTLDRVAEEARVSKGGLQYHFSSKDQLIEAMLDETLSNAGANLEARAAPLQHVPGAFTKAYLDYMREPYEGTDEADIASSILAAAALDDRLLGHSRGRFERWQSRMLADGLDESLALMARVVSDGLWLIDMFGLAPLDRVQRGRVIDKLSELIAEAAEDA